MKKEIYITDIALITIAIMIMSLLGYQIITASNINESIKLACFAFATVLFGFKGYELNRLIRKEKNQDALNFFEYYEEELDLMMTKKRINVLLFLPVFIKFSRDDIKKQKSRVNLITYGMYFFLFLFLAL